VMDEDPSIRLIRLLAVTPFQAKMNLELQQGGDAVANRPSKLDFNSPARDSAVTSDAPSSPLDWVPPTADSQLAVKYMEQLPLAKQPITGSQAAVDRKIALDRQLPSHDLDPEQCTNLSANEKRK
jgi:PET Domain